MHEYQREVTCLKFKVWFNKYRNKTKLIEAKEMYIPEIGDF